MTKSRSPKGGVVKLISSASSMAIGDQIGSYPRFMASGKKIGTVRSIMEICSMNIPSSNKTANITINMAIGASSKEMAQLTSPLEAPEKAKSWLKVAD